MKAFNLILALSLLLVAGCAREATSQPSTATTAPQATAALADAGPTSTATPVETPGATPTTVPAASPASAAAGGNTYLPYAGNKTPPTATPTPTATPPVYPTHDGPPLDPDRVGVQLHIHREDLDALMGHLRELGVGWVKVQVSWKIYEPQPNQYDDFRFGELDRLVEAANASGMKVFLGVAKAPEWSRPTTEMDGPPSDPALYQRFMSALATRYRGRVAAYELWNEANLQREWTGFPLNAGQLVELISNGAAGVRAADPAALLISAAPATTGINDGVIAIDDRVFLGQMLAQGVGNIVDGIGVHPYGWANPADASYTDAVQEAPTHNNHPSFFYKDTMRDYRSILDDAGYGNLPLWVTEFGWGSFEGFGASPPDGAEFMNHVTEWEQGEYIIRAHELALEWGGVGPLLLWNLNFAATFGTEFSESGYSLLRPDGSLRPAYYSVRSLTQPAPE